MGTAGEKIGAGRWRSRTAPRRPDLFSLRRKSEEHSLAGADLFRSGGEGFARLAAVEPATGSRRYVCRIGGATARQEGGSHEDACIPHSGFVPPSEFKAAGFKAARIASISASRRTGF